MHDHDALLPDSYFLSFSEWKNDHIWRCDRNRHGKNVQRLRRVVEASVSQGINLGLHHSAGTKSLPSGTFETVRDGYPTGLDRTAQLIQGEILRSSNCLFCSFKKDLLLGFCPNVGQYAVRKKSYCEDLFMREINLSEIFEVSEYFYRCEQLVRLSSLFLSSNKSETRSSSPANFPPPQSNKLFAFVTANVQPKVSLMRCIVPLKCTALGDFSLQIIFRPSATVSESA